jgi:hypothetical protein
MKRRIASITLTFLAIAIFQFFLTPVVFAEPWKKVGGWSIVHSPDRGGCTMAASYESGSELLLSLNYANRGKIYYDLRIGNAEWKSVKKNKKYTVEIFFSGSTETGWRQKMKGFRTRIYGLSVSYAASSDFATFIATGVEDASSVSFYLDDQPIGVFLLPNSKRAHQEFLKCFQNHTSNFLGLSRDPFQ